MNPTVARIAKRVAYQSAPSVTVRGEAVFARLAGHTLAGAHSRILMLRREADLVVRAMLEAGQPERAVWFASPIMSRLDVGVVPASLDVAAVAEQEDDAAEDVRWEQYRVNPTPDTQRLYERAAHNAIASTLAKRAALRGRE